MAYNPESGPATKNEKPVKSNTPSEQKTRTLGSAAIRGSK